MQDKNVLDTGVKLLSGAVQNPFKLVDVSNFKLKKITQYKGSKNHIQTFKGVVSRD
jgi:hypothetical protein